MKIDHSNSLRSILEAEDCRVYSAESGEEARGEVSKLRPDLIIPDIIIPNVVCYMQDLKGGEPEESYSNYNTEY